MYLPFSNRIFDRTSQQPGQAGIIRHTHLNGKTYKSVGNATLVASVGCASKCFLVTDLIDTLRCESVHISKSKASKIIEHKLEHETKTGLYERYLLLSTMMNGGKSCVAILQKLLSDAKTSSLV